MAKINYDKALAELEEISTQLQSGEIGLEQLSDKIKRAGELLKYCKEKLRSTEEELDKLVEENT